jgi:hypothetical protein
MPADSKGDILNYIKYRFYTDRLYNLGERFTLTVADDDSGLDRRWNLWQAVERNDNDSNSNSVVDLLDRNLASADPDIVKLGGLWPSQPDWLLTDAELSVRYDQSAQRPLMLSPDGVLRLFYDPAVIRIWDSPKKEKLFAPYGGIPGEIGHSFTGHETLWIEGYNKGSTEVYATWTPNTPGYFVNEYMNHLVSHSFTVNVAGIDVDIDSDNDSKRSQAFERDDWNEYLEDSPYALGKFVGADTRSGYVPFVVEISGIGHQDRYALAFSIKDFGVDSLRFEITYRDKDHTPILLDRSYYLLSELGIHGEGNYTFWVRQKYPSGNIKKYVDTPDIPSVLNAKLYWTGGPFPRIHEDSVQIREIFHNNDDPINVKDPHGEFPMALQADGAVRDAGASTDVYGDNETAEAKKFALKRLDRHEIMAFVQIGDPVLLNYLTTNEEGFFARMYLDHCDTVSTKAPKDGGGRYIIAFRGSELKMDDWLANLGQGAFGASDQFMAALSVGERLAQNNLGNVSLTGHSLGGGLAAAAVYSSGLTARTFNAEGVNPAIFWGSITRMKAGDTPLFPTARDRWQFEQEQGKFTLITAYQIVHDFRRDVPCLLTWLQNTGANGTIVRTWVADGRKVEQEGLLNFEQRTWPQPDEAHIYFHMTRMLTEVFKEATSREDFVARVGVLLASAEWRGLFGLPGVAMKMGTSHKLPSVLYGLLHDDSVYWNAYDNEGHVDR